MVGVAVAEHHQGGGVGVDPGPTQPAQQTGTGSGWAAVEQDGALSAYGIGGGLPEVDAHHRLVRLLPDRSHR